ncbi:hypothetical protein [Rhodococcus tukisamuensis]|nr:hypothetical protein [Rhodococcus tukisamuensis]
MSEASDTGRDETQSWCSAMRWVHWCFVAGVVAVAMVGVIALYFAEQQPLALDLAAIAGIVLSAAGVAGAVVIFSRQAAQARRESYHHTQFMQRTDSSLRELTTSERFKTEVGETAARLDEAEPSDQEAQGPADARFEEPAESLGLRTSNDSIVYDPKNVSLWMLAAVVDHWNSQGTTGRWDVGALKGAVKRRSGGNSSWYLVFEDPDTDRLDYYRVSMGGRGKSGPTVTPMTVTETVAALNK